MFQEALNAHDRRRMQELEVQLQKVKRELEDAKYS